MTLLNLLQLSFQILKIIYSKVSKLWTLKLCLCNRRRGQTGPNWREGRTNRNQPFAVTTIPFIHTNQKFTLKRKTTTISVWKIIKYFNNGFAISILFWYAPGNNHHHRFGSSTLEENHWPKLKIWTLTSRTLIFLGLLSIGLIPLKCQEALLIQLNVHNGYMSAQNCWRQWNTQFFLKNKEHTVVLMQMAS